METNYSNKDTVRAHLILFVVTITMIIIATGLKVQMWATNGTFYTARDEQSVVSYVRDTEDPTTTYTVLATGHGDDIITFFPKYLPWEGQNVSMVRFYAETKTKKFPYLAWVTPKTVSISHIVGKLDYTIDEGDRTDQIGYVRNNSIRRYTVTFDKNIPHYRTLSFGVLPEIGDTIRFWYLEIFFSREKFFNLAILY